MTFYLVWSCYKKPVKTLIGALFLVLSFSIVACEQYEAQFIGKVSSATRIAEKCLIEIDFTQLRSHILCPLSIEDVVNTDIYTKKGACEALKGKSISGYLIQKSFADYIFVE